VIGFNIESKDGFYMQLFYLSEKEEKKEEKKDPTEEKSTTYKYSRMVIDFIKDLYKKDDEELLGEGSNIIRKLMALGVTVAGIMVLPFNAGITVIIAAIAWYIDRVLESNATKKQKDALLLKLETEIENLKDRIDKAKDSGNLKEKENLIKLRNVLISKASKLRRDGAKSGLESGSGSSDDDD